MDQYYQNKHRKNVEVSPSMDANMHPNIVSMYDCPALLTKDQIFAMPSMFYLSMFH